MPLVSAFILAALALLILLVIILLITELKITVQLLYNERDHLLRLHVTAWHGLIEMKREWQFFPVLLEQKPAIVYQGETEKHGQPLKRKKGRKSWADVVKLHKKVREMVREVRGLKGILRQFGRKVTVTRWQWHSSLGTGYADETGVLTGLAWCFKSLTTGFIQRHLRWGTIPEISVHPIFQKPLFHTHFTCTIRFRVGYALLAGIKIIIRHTFKRTPRKGLKSAKYIYYWPWTP